ncbi:MAG: orotidine-5'-phosphate decarboxylase, partial [Blastocatellia bacterium]
MSQRLIVALDVSDRPSALRLVEQLNDLGVSFKIGSQLFTAEGPDLVREIVSSGSPVFLDLKFHDIPNTVAGAVTSAAGLGVTIINIHGLGGSEMMQAASRAVNEVLGPQTIPGGTHKARPAVIAVTVLTSMSFEGLSEVGVGEGVESEVIRLARLARTSGLDGV